MERWAASADKPAHPNPNHIPWSITKLKGRYHLRHIKSWCPIPGTQIREETAEKEEHDKLMRGIGERAAEREERSARKGRARAVAMPQKEAIMSAYGKGNVPTQIDQILFEKKARVEQMEKERRAITPIEALYFPAADRTRGDLRTVERWKVQEDTDKQVEMIALETYDRDREPEVLDMSTAAGRARLAEREPACGTDLDAILEGTGCEALF